MAPGLRPCQCSNSPPPSHFKDGGGAHFKDGSGARAVRIRSGLGFAHRVAWNDVTARNRRDIVAFLLLASELHDAVAVGVGTENVKRAVGTLELLALVLLVCSAIAGYRRIERSIEVTLLKHRLLRANEKRGALVSKAQSGPLVNESTRHILSPQIAQQHFGALVSARVWSAYS